MAQRADNNIYLSIDNVVVTARFQSVKFEANADEKDVTTGANQGYRQRRGGLLDTSMSVTLDYDDAEVDAYLSHLQPGDTVNVIYGPDGSSAGSPKHQQSMLITSMTFEVNVSKDPVAFDISLMGADTPTYNLFTDTF